MNLTKYISVFILLVFVLCLGACHESDGRHTGLLVGGPCEYVKFNGHATIIAVKNADPTGTNFKNAVEVIFTFSPDNPSDTASYRIPDPKNLHFTVGAGMNPPRDWAQRKGLVVGSVHRCIRREIIKGACSPVEFSFPDIDLIGWEGECF